MQAKRYPAKMRIMHWVMSPLILLMLIAGLYMTSDFAPAQYKFSIYGIHKSMGLLLFVMIIMRFFIRRSSSVPPLPHELGKVQQKLAIAGHHFMYLCIFLIPISGYLMSVFGGYTVSFFGIPLVNLFAKNEALGAFFYKAHSVLNYILICLLIGHIIAPFKHYFIDKVNVWKRMI